eukprot:2891377-Prymnesium_polylepis.1
MTRPFWSVLSVALQAAHALRRDALEHALEGIVGNLADVLGGGGHRLAVDLDGHAHAVLVGRLEGLGDDHLRPRRHGHLERCS